MLCYPSLRDMGEAPACAAPCPRGIERSRRGERKAVPSPFRCSCISGAGDDVLAGGFIGHCVTREPGGSSIRRGDWEGLLRLSQLSFSTARDEAQLRESTLSAERGESLGGPVAEFSPRCGENWGSAQQRSAVAEIPVTWPLLARAGPPIPPFLTR